MGELWGEKEIFYIWLIWFLILIDNTIVYVCEKMKMKEKEKTFILISVTLTMIIWFFSQINWRSIDWFFFVPETCQIVFGCLVNKWASVCFFKIFNFIPIDFWFESKLWWSSLINCVCVYVIVNRIRVCVCVCGISEMNFFVLFC